MIVPLLTRGKVIGTIGMPGIDDACRFTPYAEAERIARKYRFALIAVTLSALVLPGPSAADAAVSPGGRSCLRSSSPRSRFYSET